jgi:transcriptional regulator with XRE-family HTH domain
VGFAGRSTLVAWGPEAGLLNDTCARFGSALRESRIHQRLTQERLAERSGLSYKFIGEIERGKGNPTLTTMARLAEALDVDLATLIRGRDESQSSSSDYRISRDHLQAVSEAVASVEALVNQVASPPYRKRQRKRSTKKSKR